MSHLAHNIAASMRLTSTVAPGPGSKAGLCATSRKLRWEFPKIGDPNIVPYVVGSLVDGPQNKVPLIFGNSRMTNLKTNKMEALHRHGENRILDPWQHHLTEVCLVLSRD